jgi:hypothetical protein
MKSMQLGELFLFGSFFLFFFKSLTLSFQFTSKNKVMQKASNVNLISNYNDWSMWLHLNGPLYNPLHCPF